ncbi:MAG: GumC family protein [Candidatus Bipolaricaulia bacterium]
MEEYEVSLREYIEVLWQKKWIILIVLVAAVATAAVFSSRAPEQYETQTKLLISPRIAEQLTDDQENPLPPILGAFSAGTYRSLAMASDLLQEIITSLDLRGNPDGKLWSVEQLVGMMDPRVEETNQRREARSLPLLTMVVRGGDPKMIQRIADKWAALFIAKNTELLSTASTQSFQFIEDQYQKTSQALQTKEEERKRSQVGGSLETLESEFRVLRIQYESSLVQLLSNRLKLVEKEAEVQNLEQELETEPEFLSFERAVPNEVIWSLLRENPDVSQLNALADLVLIDQERNEIFFSLREQLVQARITVNILKSEIAYLEDQTVAVRDMIDEQADGITETRLTLDQLDREISALKSTFSLLSTKLQEARIAKEEQLNTIRVVEAAIVPQVPIGSNQRLNVLIAGVLGLFLGVLLAFFTHYMEAPKDVAADPDSKEATKE